MLNIQIQYCGKACPTPDLIQNIGGYPEGSVYVGRCPAGAAALYYEHGVEQEAGLGQLSADVHVVVHAEHLGTLHGRQALTERRAGVRRMTRAKQ